jgi:hypothetical protein
MSITAARPRRILTDFPTLKIHTENSAGSSPPVGSAHGNTHQRIFKMGKKINHGGDGEHGEIHFKNFFSVFSVISVVIGSNQAASGLGWNIW